MAAQQKPEKTEAPVEAPVEVTVDEEKGNLVERMTAFKTGRQNHKFWIKG